MKLPRSVVSHIYELPADFRGTVTLNTNGKEWSIEVTTRERDKTPELVDVNSLLDISDHSAHNDKNS